MMAQVTIATMKGYGPWTLTLGHDREHRLQQLQASMYAEAQRLFAERRCLVFHNRYDEYVIASDGLDQDGHNQIQQALEKRFGIPLRMHTGRGDTPADADGAAHRARLQDVPLLGEATNGTTTILHLDVDDLTSRTRDRTPYGISMLILDLHARMARHFSRLQSLTFFMGGDNFMVLAGPDAQGGIREFVDATAVDLDINLNCGVGRGPTARDAAMMATRSLDTIRNMRDSGTRQDIYESDCC